MTVSAPSKTDLMYEITFNSHFVPRCSSKVNVKTVTIDGVDKYFMKDHETGTLYNLSEFDNDLWNYVDGKRTVKEITEAMMGMYRDLRPDFVKESLLCFAEEGVLKSSLEPIKKKRAEIVSAFRVRISLIGESKEFVRSVHRLVRPLLKKWLLWVTVAFVAVMGILFASSFVSIFTHKENFEIMGSTVVGFFFYSFIVLAPIIVVHEIAHGLALVHYGGAPREMGTGLYFFSPMFFIDVTDGWTLKRYQRIMVFVAGPLSTIMIGSLIMAVQYFWELPASISHVLTMATFFCFYGLLIDLSPLLETDGYFILCDAVRIPDLREKSFTYLKTVAKRFIKKTVGKESDALAIKTKAILLLYAGLAAVWAVYLLLRSLMVATYMAEDTTVSVLNISSGILNRSVTVTGVVLTTASLLYFSMAMSGYGLLLFSAIKRATRKTLRLEAIHDRDLSVFLYLPKRAPQWLFTSLKQEMAQAAKKFTHNFSVRQIGSMCVAVLRMSSAKLAFVQIKEHFRNIEEKFDSVYEGFLERNKNEILDSIGIYGSGEARLAVQLSEMGKQAKAAGITAGKAVVSQVVGRQAKTALCLLHSVHGRIWTVELPPNLLQDIGKTFLPTLLVEDMSITDLYDETEEFKKRTIYGFDSLAMLAQENQKALEEVLSRPEKYHVISFYEPIKSRLLFVGRTEQIENVLDILGGLFVCQAWSGYLDNLLSEVNFNLFALNMSSLPDTKSIQLMKDGEIAVLEKNLSLLIAHENFVTESLSDLKSQVKCANLELEKLRRCLEPNGGFKVGLLDAALQINAENIAHLPSQFESLRILSRELYAKIKRTRKSLEREVSERKLLTAKKKRRRLALFPFFLVWSAILAFLGLQMFTGYVTIMALASALLLQLLYWAAYLLFSRSFNVVDQYPSLAFRRVHFFAFAFTESLYKFMTTATLLTPDGTRLAKS